MASPTPPRLSVGRAGGLWGCSWRVQGPLGVLLQAPGELLRGLPEALGELFGALVELWGALGELQGGLGDLMRSSWGLSETL